MSNFIPMVSSSPPPIDAHQFECDGDVEEFGIFTGANDSNFSNEDISEYDTKWSKEPIELSDDRDKYLETTAPISDCICLNQESTVQSTSRSTQEPDQCDKPIPISTQNIPKSNTTDIEDKPICQEQIVTDENDKENKLETFEKQIDKIPSIKTSPLSSDGDDLCYSSSSIPHISSVQNDDNLELCDNTKSSVGMSLPCIDGLHEVEHDSKCETQGEVDVLSSDRPSLSNDECENVDTDVKDVIAEDVNYIGSDAVIETDSVYKISAVSNETNNQDIICSEDMDDICSNTSEDNIACDSAIKVEFEKDFASFETNTEQSSWDDESQFDDFADFSCANFEEDHSSENFSSIQAETKLKDKINDDSDDDWCNFSENSTNLGYVNVVVIKETLIPDEEKVKDVLSTCFEDDALLEENLTPISLLESLLIGALCQPSSIVSNHLSHKVLHWVLNYDDTNALIYHWKKSNSNNKLFATLKIDTKNMLFGLKKQVVPLSVTSLTLLEPVRGDGKADEFLSKLVETSVKANTSPLQDIPPIEFDWDNSGLVNPLEARTLDLEFMMVQDNDSGSKNGVFRSELLDAPKACIKPMQPLEDILKTMKLTTVTQPDSNNGDISIEARNIIDSLPILSFMKSKVLMFRLQE